MSSQHVMKACQVCGASIDVSPMDAEVSCPVCGSEYEVLIHGAKSTTKTVVASAPALIPTTFYAFAVSPSTGTVPLTVYISGYLQDETGIGLNGKTIKIYKDGVLLKSVSTSRYEGVDGYFATTDTLTTEGTYKYYAEFPGDATYAGCSKLVRQLRL